jgi:predicted transcriptional regulator YheO
MKEIGKTPVTHMRHDEAVTFLDEMARGLARTFGPNCEALVQEIDESGACTVLSIYNGQVTGRHPGSTLSVYGNDTSADADEGRERGILDLDPDEIVCSEAITQNGRRIKTSTWLLRGKGFQLALGVNIDVTTLCLASEVISGIASTSGDLRDNLREGRGAGADADTLIDECASALGRPVEAMDRDDCVELVRMLGKRGFFEYHKSATQLAARLGVSKSTVYNYMHRAQKTECDTSRETSQLSAGGAMLPPH